jgi:hypothetical protein
VPQLPPIFVRSTRRDELYARVAPAVRVPVLNGRSNMSFQPISGGAEGCDKAADRSSSRWPDLLSFQLLDNKLFDVPQTGLQNVRSAKPWSIAPQNAAPRLEAVKWRPPSFTLAN